jgi:hypothetical protein
MLYQVARWEDKAKQRILPPHPYGSAKVAHVSRIESEHPGSGQLQHLLLPGHSVPFQKNISAHAQYFQGEFKRQ